MAGTLVRKPEQVLLQLGDIKTALAACRTVDEAKVLRDKAQAVQHFLKRQAYHLDIQNLAAEAKLRCERRLGELLAETTVKGGRRHKLDDLTCVRVSTLPDGVNKFQSSTWQRIASLEDDTFEGYIEETKDAHKELTTAGALKLAKRKADQEQLAAFPTDVVGDLQALIDAGRQYGTIYADPPWKYGNQGTRSATDTVYPTMTVDEICALPVASLAATVAHLHLWTTNAFLFEAKRVMDAWGFEYKSVFVWVKPQMGIGNYWRVSHEFMLLGVRGACSFRDKSLKSWACIERTQHSAKPHEIRKFIEAASPGPRLELFGRRTADEWTVWGNETERGMFDDDVKELS